MSMTVSIQPAFVWTLARFLALAAWEKAYLSRIGSMLDASADLMSALKQ